MTSTLTSWSSGPRTVVGKTSRRRKSSTSQIGSVSSSGQQGRSSNLVSLVAIMVLLITALDEHEGAAYPVLCQQRTHTLGAVMLVSSPRPVTGVRQPATSVA